MSNKLFISVSLIVPTLNPQLHRCRRHTNSRNLLRRTDFERHVSGEWEFRFASTRRSMLAIMALEKLTHQNGAQNGTAVPGKGTDPLVLHISRQQCPGVGRLHVFTPGFFTASDVSRLSDKAHPLKLHRSIPHLLSFNAYCCTEDGQGIR